MTSPVDSRARTDAYDCRCVSTMDGPRRSVSCGRIAAGLPSSIPIFSSRLRRMPEPRLDVGDGVLARNSVPDANGGLLGVCVTEGNRDTGERTAEGMRLAYGDVRTGDAIGCARGGVAHTSSVGIAFDRAGAVKLREANAGGSSIGMATASTATGSSDGIVAEVAYTFCSEFGEASTFEMGPLFMGDAVPGGCVTTGADTGSCRCTEGCRIGPRPT